MSIRAYRVIKKEIAKSPSFNLWHDDKLIDFFKDNSENYSEQLNESGGGEIEIEVSALEKALKEFEWDEEDYRIDSIKADIAFAKKHKDDYVLYECF